MGYCDNLIRGCGVYGEGRLPPTDGFKEQNCWVAGSQACPVNLGLAVVEGNSLGLCCELTVSALPWRQTVSVPPQLISAGKQW